MSKFNQTYNYDYVFLRNIIVGFLAELNKKLVIYNQLDDGTTETVDVPCIFSITGQERFLMDEFFYDAINNGKAIGDYEKVPRCVVNLDGVSVDTSRQTNKYIRTRCIRYVNDIPRTLVLMTDFVPINLSFNCDIICSNHIELMKISECIISKIYKNQNLFNIDLDVFNVQANYNTPIDFNHERPTEFALNDKKEFKISTQFELSTFIPCFENGILLPEIDLMLHELNSKGTGIIEFRSDNKGIMKMCQGGIIENFRFAVYPDKTKSIVSERVVREIITNACTNTLSYATAVDAGFQGTETEFNKLIAGMMNCFNDMKKELDYKIDTTKTNVIKLKEDVSLLTTVVHNINNTLENDIKPSIATNTTNIEVNKENIDKLTLIINNHLNWWNIDDEIKDI